MEVEELRPGQQDPNVERPRAHQFVAVGLGALALTLRPAESPADDAEFLRRTYLNVIGRIPSVFEVLEFLDDPSPDKRRRLVEQLLDSPSALNQIRQLWQNAPVLIFRRQSLEGAGGRGGAAGSRLVRA